jgi:hypothetical protein
MSEFLKDGHKPLQLQMTALIRMEKKPASASAPEWRRKLQTLSSLTRPCPLPITRGARNTIAFEINQLLLIRRKLREKGDNFAKESAHGVAEKRCTGQRVTDFVPLPLGAD